MSKHSASNDSAKFWHQKAGELEEEIAELKEDNEKLKAEVAQLKSIGRPTALIDSGQIHNPCIGNLKEESGE